MLMGLVTKNVILLVDFTNQARRGGVITPAPILMTTLAMIFGMLPLAFVIGRAVVVCYDTHASICASGQLQSRRG